MTEGFFGLFETDMGSKGRAKRAATQTSRRIATEGRREMDDWLRKLWNLARDKCPVDTGTLRDTIRIQEKGMAFGVARSEFERIVRIQNELINANIIAGGMLINPKTGRICDYAQAVHDGHFTRGGKFILPRPFLTDALNELLPELEQKINNVITRTGEQVWRGS